jgi:hypothetical protein
MAAKTCHLITSREGLYIFDSATASFRCLKRGYFFGLAKHNGLWFVFGYEGKTVDAKNHPTFQGYIASFRLTDNFETEDWKERWTDLDNGSHQLRIHKLKLYLLETYIQTILVFDIDADGSLRLARKVPLYDSLIPVVNAQYIVNGSGTECSCKGYKHINAFTIHDDLIYLSCPSLRNSITQDGKPTQTLSPHVIEVYDLDFNFLWSYIIPDEVFCHDIVFHGHTLYFNAPPNKVCGFDIVTKTITRKTVLSVEAFHPRGLSIYKDGTAMVGLRRHGMLVVFNMSNTNDIQDIQYIKAPCEPCFIAHVDYDNDFNNIDGHLVKNYVKQVHTNDLPIDLSALDEISNYVFKNDWTLYKDLRLEQGTKNICSAKKYDLLEVIEPHDEVFDDILNLQEIVGKKIHISQLIVEDEVKSEHDAIIDLLTEIEKQVQRRALRVSGHLYLYPPQSALGWHTNLEEPYNHNTVRCYIVNTTKNNETFFFYRHPISKLIHAVPDRKGFANIFCLGNTSSPLWHAVYNDSVDTQRLSLGIAFHQYRLGAFHKLKDTIAEISH